MEYVIELLEKERRTIEQCLTEWDMQQYPEARKEREIRLKELNQAINLINNK